MYQTLATFRRPGPASSSVSGQHRQLRGQRHVHPAQAHAGIAQQELHRSPGGDAQQRTEQKLHHRMPHRQRAQPQPHVNQRPAHRQGAKVGQVAFAPVDEAQHEHEAAHQQQAWRSRPAVR
jgi:hypothetical protein